MDHSYVISVIIAMGLVTFGLRALPFLAAQWLQKHPLVQKLGQFLPLAIMTLLLVHALVGAAAEHTGGLWTELIAAVCVVLLQWFGKNALLSILLGTLIYVLLRNFSFF